MSEVNGSAEAAEKFRLGILRQICDIRDDGKIAEKLKDLESLYGEEVTLPLREPFENAVAMLIETMKSLADVLEGMKRYQDFLQAIKNRDKMGEDYAPRRETVVENGFFAGKAIEISTRKLEATLANSFKGGRYRSIRTTKQVILWRVYGEGSEKCGMFLLTHLPEDALAAKQDAAMLPQWKNSRQNYCAVTIPKGTILEVGKVGGQYTYNGQLLAGGTDQVLLMEARDCPDWFGEEKELKIESRYQKFIKGIESIENLT